MGNPGRSIRLRSGGRTDTGRVRDNNEDNIHLWNTGEHMVLAVVADGMGGAVAGEEASRIAVETIYTDFVSSHLANGNHDLELPELVTQLKESIRDANANIIEQALDHPEFKGMGTTITLAFVMDRQVIVGHVGDSRAYHITPTDEHITQITSDHTFVQALVNGGHLTAEEAENHPMGNVLYRALGQAYDVEIDIYYLQWQAGDRIVLCSDGLTLHVRPYEIAEVVLTHDDPELASAALVELANERGGRDNVSVIVLHMEKVGDAHAVGEDSQLNPLRGDEDTGNLSIPRENTNMGASESPAMTLRDTGTQETVRVPPPAESLPHAPTSTPPKRRTDEQAAVEREGTGPGEGRDPLLPDQ